MRQWWLHVLVGLALLLPAVGACTARTDQPAELRVRARAIPLQEDAPDRVRLGDLRFEAGFVLSADDPGFGGMSGLWIAPDGREIAMVSDRGTLWRAALEHADDRLSGIGDWSQRTLPRAPDDRAGRADAEALADDGRGLIVAYEGEPYLRRLMADDPNAPAQPLPVPAGLAGSGNTGVEALAALPDGALLALSEGVSDAPGRLTAWRIEGKRTLPLSYVTVGGFVPTGADRLEDTIYVVERRFSLRDGGFATRLVALDVALIGAGALVGRELARLGRPAISENFEGIAVRRAADGRTLLYLIADDNFFGLQRTLLLQFSLPNA